ncbi:MAG: hypothetical protein HY872_00935 [Chloroflexi bacterium]|nr:hypothetical protein [Chloroflexota bacterium]
MPSKLGPHVLTTTDSARKMLDAGCRIIKMVDDFGLGQGLENNPNVTVIGRVYANDPRTAEAQQKGGESPENAARRFINSQKEKYRLNPHIKIWEGHNEPVWGSHEEMAWYAAFDAARLKILADMGLRGVIGCFATGVPGDIELWKSYIPAVQAAKQYHGILGLHEYSSPWMWWMTGRYQLKDEDEGDEGWVTLRYRKVMHKYLKPVGCDDVLIAITESGLDRVGYVPPGASSGNWRTNAEWWKTDDGSKDPIDYWRNGGRDPEVYFAEQLMWYDRELRKDPNVLGAVIFTVGYLDPTWKDYDIAGTRVIDHLVDYIRREAAVPNAAAGSRAASVVTPPPAAPAVQPAVVITPPASGQTAGANLLANGDFDDGQHYRWHNTPEIVIPNKWDFWHATHSMPYLPRQDQNFDPPECVVWNIAGAPAEEKNLFWLSGTYCLKIFKGWGAIWWRLFQNVGGLTPGQRYRFTAPIYPDLYMKFDPLQGGKILADDPLAGEVRLSAKFSGNEIETGWLDGAQFPFGKYTFFALDFVVVGASAEVSVEGRGRWGLLNNGWFVDSLRLEAIGGAAPPVPGGNLLKNPVFTGGTYLPNSAVRNMEAPNGWQFWAADERTPKVSRQTESFRAPRAGVVTPATASPDDKDGLAGGLAQAYRVVGNWRAIWFSISQPLSGLTPGRQYRFTVQLMPDPVDKYGAGNAKQFAADPDGGEVWLKAQSAGQKTETLKRVTTDLAPGGYSTLTHDFTAATSEATVTLEVRARFALTQNAWYIASAGVSPL